MIKSTRGANPKKYTLGKGFLKVGKRGESVGEISSYDLTEAILIYEARNLRSPDPQEW